MALTVTEGELISSVKYRSRRDGIAKRTRIIAGRIVQIASISWESIASVHVLSFVISINMAYAVTDITRVKITNAWSWNDAI
jgi:hypothetical protein